MTNFEIVLWLITVALSIRFGWVLREMKYESDQQDKE